MYHFRHTNCDVNDNFASLLFKNATSASAMQRPLIHIQLQFDTRYGRDIARGIISYARQNTQWQLSHVDMHVDLVLHSQSRGVIGQFYYPSGQGFMIDSKIPLVKVGQESPDLRQVELMRSSRPVYVAAARAHSRAVLQVALLFAHRASWLPRRRPCP